MNNKRGLYIHIPFCLSKCGYCDFYSFSADESKMDAYLCAVKRELECFGRQAGGRFDTLYFGGGTPSVFGGRRIAEIIKAARKSFDFDADTEITVECNPSSVDEELAEALNESGVNRISMGMQSALDNERKLLGRRSDPFQVERAIKLFQKIGIDNISLDIMLAIAQQTVKSLDKSLDFALNSGAKHISAYMLKLEEGTPLYKNRKNYSFPDEDEACEMYLHTVERLESAGFSQYEISNFALLGKESRHNLKYWHCEEYLGIGPSAHSFFGGKRFYYDRNFDSFVRENSPVSDGIGGTEDEYVMLALRLCEGLNNNKYKQRYNKNLPKEMFDLAKQFEKSGHTKVSEESIALTPKGFLISNYIIGELIGLLNTNYH